MKKSILVAVLSLALIVVAAIALAELITIEKMKAQQPYLSSDKPAIERAISKFQTETKSDRVSAMKGRFPVVVRFGGVRCVALQVQHGHIGRTPVYCYDMDYHQVNQVRTDAEPVVDVR